MPVRRVPVVPLLVQGMPRPRACRAPRFPGSGAASATLAARVIPAAACERHRIPGGQLGEGDRQRGAGDGETGRDHEGDKTR